MQPLQEINELVEAPYGGLMGAWAMLKTQRSLNFYGGDKILQDVGVEWDRRLHKDHGITDATDNAHHTLPLLYHLRETFDTYLEQVPKDIETARKRIDAILTTVQTIRSVNDVVPFRDEQPDVSFLKRLRNEEPDTDIIDEMVKLEKETVAQWNARRKAKKMSEARPWTADGYRMMIGREDIVGSRLSLQSNRKNGDDGVGHFFLREEGKDTYALLDYAARDVSTMPQFLVMNILMTMKRENRLKLVNEIENGHGV